MIRTVLKSFLFFTIFGFFSAGGYTIIMMKQLSELHLFRAFRSRNYSLYFVGRTVSQFGTWMQRTAVVWVVYSITHSSFWIGATLFAEIFPSFLFSIPGGVAADRYDRNSIIKITQITSMAQAVLLAALIFTGHTLVWAILALSVLLGIINAFDVPARQALIHDVVTDKAHLPNALALTTAMANMAQLLGPALAGIVLNAFGAPVCFLLNAASFAGVLLSLLLMKLPHKVMPKSDKHVMAEFAAGWQYFRQTPKLFLLLVMLSFISLLVLPYNTVIPVFAKEIFKGDASTFGYINSFVGVGAVVGTIYIAWLKAGAHLKRILLVSTIVLGLGLIGFSQARSFPVAMMFAAMIGYGAMSQFSICNIIVQSESAPAMRGRMIGLMLMTLFGMMPVGSLMVGAISQHIGAPVTVLGQGILCLVIVLFFVKFLLHHEVPKTNPPDAGIQETEELIEEQIG